MCLEPHFISDAITGEGRVVVCRKCWQCRDRRVSDWMGRCIAEGRTAKSSSYVTLTYGREDGSPDHLRASVLTYSDFQKWLKRLRKAGHAVRYFVVGEYGGTYGRAHWHALLYWLSEPPKVAMRVNKVQALWDDGFSYWDNIGHDTARYACKYILKDEGDELKQAHMQMSKVPPLGAEYFSGLALKYVKAGLAPRDKVYKFRDVIGAEGNPKKFYLSGRSWELFVEALVFWSELLRPGHNGVYQSQVVMDHLDSLQGDWRDVAGGARRIFCEPRNEDGVFLGDLAEEEDNRRWDRKWRESDPALTNWMSDQRVAWSERFFCPVYQPDGRFMPPLYWHAERGSYRWQSVAPSEAYIRAQRFERHRVAAGRPLRGTRMDWPRPRPTSS